MAASTGAFRFLDLPGEVRNRIYDFSFGDNAEEDTVDIMAVRSLLPNAALTKTCRQIREESIKLHKEATMAFCATHRVRIQMVAAYDDEPSWDADAQNAATEAECINLQQGLGTVFHKLQFDTNPQPGFANQRVRVDVDENGAAEWRCFFVGLRNTPTAPIRNAEWNNSANLQKRWLQIVAESGKSMTRGGLDIQACFEAWM